MTTFIGVERFDNGVAVLTLQNPPLNLITLEMTRQMIETLTELEPDDSVRTVVIRGQGQRAFSAGADIKEFMEVRDDVVGKKLKKENEAWSRIERFSKPVIAAIEGFAYGGGCEIALACDIRVMSETSKIGLPEINLGVIPGAGGVFRLPKLVGTAKAIELQILGEFLDAGEALRIGLVDHVTLAGEAEAKAVSLAARFAGQPLEAVKAIKKSVRASWHQTHDQAVQMTLDLSDMLFRTPDCAEGVSAFREKRKPVFQHQR
ncbi:enoyl-CoA hydratase/isomerase family protein [Paenibacillaceae bacterium WGS1546]|uniref:enoyl-CoA hydratase/isomerase family protein n=1 Tax=Cohnella sp. WGS1546 TaxID=3366810 RepID=UPI00372D03CE